MTAKRWSTILIIVSFLLFAMAGYDCADAEAAVPYAERIRRDIRNFLLTRETHETLY